MWLAARGDVEVAARKAHDAMAEHDRLPMPFERARTQLLLGQLQRRQRQKERSRATLREALQAFEAMGTRLWAERARAELARADVAPSRDLALTPSERRVAGWRHRARPTATSRRRCSSARRMSKPIWPVSTASSASSRAQNSAASSAIDADPLRRKRRFSKPTGVRGGTAMSLQFGESNLQDTSGLDHPHGVWRTQHVTCG